VWIFIFDTDQTQINIVVAGLISFFTSERLVREQEAGRLLEDEVIQVTTHYKVFLLIFA
jgi:hypothetical protein